MSLGRYCAVVTGLCLFSLGALRLALEEADFRAVASAALLAAANTTAAFALVSWSAARPSVVFFQAILGGTLARMALLLGATLAVLLGLGLPKLPFVVAILCYYLAFLVLELAVVHKTPFAPTAEVRR